VSCACAKAEGGRPLCVGASYRGKACLCFYQSDMRNLAVLVCNVVATPDYSHPDCNLNLYNFQYDNLQSKGCRLRLPCCRSWTRVDCRGLSTLRCKLAEEELL
jgi:hypothetical protein